MNPIHKQRLIYITILMTSMAIAIGLILYALKQNINVFLTPTQLRELSVPVDQVIRLGGMVKPGSVIRNKTGLEIKFIVTDFKNELVVNYRGILPDLFREGKGMIAEGRLKGGGIFIADSILAKHDETYSPLVTTHPSSRAHVVFARGDPQKKTGLPRAHALRSLAMTGYE